MYWQQKPPLQLWSLIETGNCDHICACIQSHYCLSKFSHQKKNNLCPHATKTSSYRSNIKTIMASAGRIRNRGGQLVYSNPTFKGGNFELPRTSKKM